MKYSQKTLHSSPERARYGVSFVSSKGNILCRLIKIELYKIFAIINRAIKGLHCIWFELPILRNHFVNAPSQWETMSQCNVVSHWLDVYTKWSPHTYFITPALFKLVRAFLLKCNIWNNTEITAIASSTEYRVSFKIPHVDLSVKYWYSINTIF